MAKTRGLPRDHEGKLVGKARSVPPKTLAHAMLLGAICFLAGACLACRRGAELSGCRRIVRPRSEAPRGALPQHAAAGAKAA